MSEYWKSNAKKFCEICKTWFADNKISVENHERGLKHKAMVQQRLRESSQRAREKDRKETDLRHTLLCMEQAALVSMRKDADNEKEKPKNSMKVAPFSYAKAHDPREDIRAQKKKLAELKKNSKRSQFWDPDAADYTISDNVRDQVQNLEESLLQTNTVQWVQSETENDQTYYWNIFSGDTRWELQEEPFYTAQQYSEKYAEISSKIETSLPISDAKNTQSDDTAKTEVKNEGISSHFATKQKKKSRFDERPSSSSMTSDKASEIKHHVKNIEVKLEPTGLVEIKHDTFQQSSSKQKPVEGSGPSSAYPLGPWVRVEKLKPKLQVESLPEESRKQKTIQSSSEIAEEMSLDPAEILFQEKVLPTNNLLSKKGKPKVEFKKRAFANKNARSRTND